MDLTPHHAQGQGSVNGDHILTDFAGTSGSRDQLPVSLYQGLRLLRSRSLLHPRYPIMRPLAPFQSGAENTIVHALHPAGRAPHCGALCARRGFDAFDKIVPGLVPARGRVPALSGLYGRVRCSGSSPCPQVRGSDLNSGGSGARPKHDGLNATAFPWGYDHAD